MIPFLGSIAPEFVEQSILLVNGLPVPHNLADRGGVPCIATDVADPYVREVVLVTPDPRAPVNSGDLRLLGIAVLLEPPAAPPPPAPPPGPSMPRPAIAGGAVPKIALIGNCAVQTYRILIEHMLGAPAHAAADLSAPEIRQPAFRQEFTARLRDADLILAQPNQYLDPRDFKSAGNQICLIGGFYFRGLYPDVGYIGDIDHRLGAPSDYHSLVILDAFRRGLNEADCEKSFNIGNFRRLGLLDAWKTSQDEIIHRDQELDFPLAQLVIQSCLNYGGFHSINHPTLTLCHEYLIGIFETLGIPHRGLRFSAVRDPLLAHNTCLMHDEWAEYLQLPYRASPRQRFARLQGRFLSRPEMIGYYYEEYRKHDPAHLVINSPGDMVVALRAQPELRHLAVV